jgi:hypothetical protein
VALAIGALGSLVYAIIEAPERGWTDPATLGFFGAAVALGAAFIAWELRVKQPMLNLALFRNPRFSVASLTIGLAFFSLFGAIFASTQFLQDALGYSALEAGAGMVPIALGLIVGSGSSLKLVARLGVPTVIMLGLAMVSAMLAAPCSGNRRWPTSRWGSGSSASRWGWAGSWAQRPAR